MPAAAASRSCFRGAALPGPGRVELAVKFGAVACPDLDGA